MEKLDGVQNIVADPTKRFCSFESTKPDLDYKSKLAELAETNEHLKGYTIQ